MFWLGLGIGLVCGATFGVFLTSLIIAGKADD